VLPLDDPPSDRVPCPGPAFGLEPFGWPRRTGLGTLVRKPLLSSRVRGVDGAGKPIRFAPSPTESGRLARGFCSVSTPLPRWPRSDQVTPASSGDVSERRLGSATPASGRGEAS